MGGWFTRETWWISKFTRVYTIKKLLVGPWSIKHYEPVLTMVFSNFRWVIYPLNMVSFYWTVQILFQDFVEQPPFDMEASLEESTAITPFFFVLFPGRVWSSKWWVFWSPFLVKNLRYFTRFSWWISMVISMGFSMGRILKNHGDFSGRFLEITR